MKLVVRCCNFVRWLPLNLPEEMKQVHFLQNPCRGIMCKLQKYWQHKGPKTINLIPDHSIYLPTMGFASSTSWVVTSCSFCFQGHFGQRLVPWHGCSDGWIPNVSMAGYRLEGCAAEIGLEIMAVFIGRYTSLHWFYQAWSVIICKT